MRTQQEQLVQATSAAIANNSPAHIIGGMFGLEMPHHPATPPPFMMPDSLLLLNARSAIQVVAETVSPRIIWMPSYLCGTMLHGISNQTVRFYGVDKTLRVVEPPDCDECDLVVAIEYFGFPADGNLMRHAKERGTKILLDACQGLLSTHDRQDAAFVIFSPRKFLGVTDGGILNSNTDHRFNNMALAEPPAAWALKALEAGILRREFDLHGGDRRWFTLFHDLERECPVGRFAMTGLTKMLLEHAFHYVEIAERRRENYAQLLSLLDNIALFPQLPPDVVPLGFPVAIESRDVVREALFAERIYPPVHWPTAGVVPEEFIDSHTLNGSIMTLLCDQRYTPTDMERIADIVQRTMHHRVRT